MIKDMLETVALDILKPHPRKGTETRCQRADRDHIVGHFKTTSPQGDGNRCRKKLFSLLRV